MSWFNWFSAAPKAVDDVLDKDNGLISQFGNWVGGMNLTDEEVIRYNAKTVSDVQSFVKETLNESTERSRSRRSFAQMWIKMHVGIILLCCIAAPWDSALATVYLNLATSPMISGITGAISIFYFGSHGLARINQSRHNAG
ncbi:hypothetical protein N9878_01125 [bacterium]|nr:hypothetical protein [bacterium]